MPDKWLIYTRGEIPLHRGDLFGLFKNYSPKFFGKNFSKVFYACIGGKMWWAWDRTEFLKLSSKLEKLLSDDKRSRIYIRNYIKYLEDAIRFSEKVIKKGLERISNDGLILLYREVDKHNGKALGLSNVDLDIFDFFFEDFYEKKIADLMGKKVKNAELQNIVKELSAPIFESFVAKEEKEIIKASLKSNLKKSDIKKIRDKFYWVSMGWENPNPRTLEDYINIIERYRREKDLRKKLAKMEIIKGKTALKRREIINKYRIDKEIIHWLYIVDKYTLLHDLRKECQVKWFYAAQRIMEESAKRLNLAGKDLVWFRHEEVCSFLNGKKFNRQESDSRRKAVCLILRNGRINIWSGKDAILQQRKEVIESEEKAGIIKGRSVSRGVVRGISKVCNGAEDAIKKMNKGDILITGMTLPEYLPAMKKALAIVTNEGGITCHAAVVSRELGIPCVVGTKIATKVLKDGDLVEVDANKGIVKIINK